MIKQQTPSVVEVLEREDLVLQGPRLKLQQTLLRLSNQADYLARYLDRPEARGLRNRIEIIEKSGRKNPELASNFAKNLEIGVALVLDDFWQRGIRRP